LAKAKRNTGKAIYNEKNIITIAPMTDISILINGKLNLFQDNTPPIKELFRGVVIKYVATTATEFIESHIRNNLNKWDFRLYGINNNIKMTDKTKPTISPIEYTPVIISLFHFISSASKIMLGYFITGLRL